MSFVTQVTVTENAHILQNEFPMSHALFLTRSVHLSMWDRTVKYNLKMWEITRGA